MNFVTPQFVLFFVPALWLCWRTRRWHTTHLLALLLCNYVFYAQAGAAGLAVLLTTSLVAYGFAVYCTRHKRPQKKQPQTKRRWLLRAVSVCVLLLAFFKYHDFLVETLHALCAVAGFAEAASPLLSRNVVFIAGISFFTFQAISYMVDVYRGTLRKAHGFLEVMAYISFFPTVMSGPIVRATDFMAQIDRPVLDTSALQQGFLLILSGLFKKVVLSSYLSEHIVRQVFAAPESYSSLAVAVGIYGYAAQIYCDFSGYTDLALGVGRLMGYTLPPNFRSPYLACSLKDFWRRWHISLSTWLRDYVYIPLGGNRHGKVYVNLVLTMLIGGLWHGGAWTFVLWGGLHGLGLAVNHAYSAWRNAPKNPSLPAIPFRPNAWHTLGAWLLTFHVVCLLWVFFRADSVELALAIFSKLAACTSAGEGFPLFALGAIAATLGMQLWGQRCLNFCTHWQARLPWQVQGAAVGVGVSIIMALGPEGVLPFIYFRF